MRVDVLLTHEHGLILRAADLQRPDVPNQIHRELVIVSDEQHRGFLTTFKCFANLLRAVGSRVGRAATWVHDQHLWRAAGVGVDQRNKALHEPDIDPILTTLVSHDALGKPPDVDGLTAGIPALMILASDGVCRHALTVWVVLGEVTELRFQAVNLEVELIEPALPIDPIPRIVNPLTPAALEPIIEVIPHVEALVLR